MSLELAHWKLNENDASVDVADASGNGYTGAASRTTNALTLPYGFTIDDTSDAGSYVDTSAGSYQDTSVQYSVWAYRTVGTTQFFSATPAVITLSDMSSTPFQNQVIWNVVSGADGYLISDDTNAYYVDLGQTTSVVDDASHSGWSSGSFVPPATSPQPLFSGKINGALLLDGLLNTDFIGVADDAVFDFAGDFSIALWTLFWQWNGQWWENGLIGKDTAPDKWMFCTSAGTDLVFHIQPDNFEFHSDALSWGLGEWHHCVVTRSGDDWTVYFDSVESGTTNNSISIPTISASLRLGYAEGYTKQALDDVRIYDFALTQAQVDELYNSGSGTEEPLSEPSGNTTNFFQMF